MNGFIEGGAYASDSLGESSWYPTWKSYNKIADITRPSPADLFVTLDEHPDSINDAWFMTDVIDTGIWEDFPASYHNGAGSFSFADGHSEIHRWLRKVTVAPVLKIQENGVWFDTPGNADISWVTNHCSGSVN
jgi:prepilin-type processing-associated H-X9-DG protein